MRDAPQPACTIKSLPVHMLLRAAAEARKLHPMNAPAAAPGAVGPMSIAMATTKYWGPAPRMIPVGFMEPTAPALRARILSHMNAWHARCCIGFVETAGVGVVRISRAAGGYWSYLGTDALLVPATSPTMNLEGFVMATPESEYRRVVRHEAGHALGFVHEHMRREVVATLDVAKTIDYFFRNDGWTEDMTRAQVLAPIEDAALTEGPVDVDSIMCYQLPESITTNGRPIPGGLDINARDYEFAGTIYPPPAVHAPADPARPSPARPDVPVS